ncbi:unnamed protein product [Amaranthus hypochondriacus]
MASVEGVDQDLHTWNVSGSGSGSEGREEKIFVSVRLRPLNDKEIQSNDFSDWETINHTTILFKNCLAERSMYPNAYTFDRVFGNDDSTRKVYEESAKEIALSVLNGINSSIFAYGQTSSGKTFTMCGITQYAVADIYDYIEQHMDREFVVKFSAIEIYNEHVRDLLCEETTPLRLLDDPERGTVVEKLTEETLKDKSHLLELIAVCEAQRQTGETTLNETSSRSHQILRLTIESSARKFGGGNSSMLSANVNFVDLAGSERTSQTLATGARLKEGSHINRSLLTLGKVIRTLSKGRNGHIPYRDSKLTRILQNSLGGNARTAIICTMSPAHSHLEQSRNTLLFASCAKEVSTNAKVNVVMSDKALVKQLRKELAKLESDLQNMSSIPSKGDVAAALREKELQIEKMDKEIKELSRQRDLAQSKVEELLQSTRKEQVFEPRVDEFSHRKSESRDKISWLDDPSETSDTSDYQRLDADLATSDYQRLDADLATSDYQRLDADLATSEAFKYHDDQGTFDLTSQRSDLLEDIDQNLFHNDSLSQGIGGTTPDFTIDDASLGSEKMANTANNIRRKIDEKSEETCKQVRCVEVEEKSINKSDAPNANKFFSREKEIQRENEKKKESESEKDKPKRERVVSIEEINSIDEKQTEKERESESEKTKPKKEHDVSTEEIGNIEEKHIEKDKESESEKDKPKKEHVVSTEEIDIIEEKQTEKEKDIESEKDKPKKEHVISTQETDSIEEKQTEQESKRINGEKKEERKIHECDVTDHDSLVQRIKELQRTIDMLVNRNPSGFHSPCSTDSEMSSNRASSFSRSRSCKAILTSTPTSDITYDRAVLHSRDLSFNGFDREISSERPKGLPRVLDHHGSFNTGKQSKLGVPMTSIRTAILHEMIKDVKNSDASYGSSFYNSILGSNRDIKYEPHKQTGDEMDGGTVDEENESKESESSGGAQEVGSYTMRVRDCMSEGTITGVQSPLNWYDEFESQRIKIIELWHECLIPLVHRTYFYLLFKGDPSDKIYIEVELRRLSFIKNRFDQGLKIVMDGQVFTPSSSIRALNQEREMLVKQMYKKIPAHEREGMFKKWGIVINSKQRRLQLVRLLWTDTKDMQHIRESAELVAKLVGFVDEGQVPKEMFVGPSVFRRSFNRRSYSWKSNMSIAS